jgi:splicing factor 3B subunit 2
MAAAEVDPSPNSAPTTASDLPNGSKTKAREADRRRRRRKAKKNKSAAEADAQDADGGASASDAKENADPNPEPQVSDFPRRILRTHLEVRHARHGTGPKT